MGIWRVTGSNQLQNMAVRSISVLNSTPCGNKIVGIRNRMGMKFASKSNGTLVVKSQLFKMVEGVLGVTGPTNTQKDDLHAAAVPSSTVAQPIVLDLCGLLFLLRIIWGEEMEEEEGEEQEEEEKEEEKKNHVGKLSLHQLRRRGHIGSEEP
eukprot:1151839-Pelagomonas_calceolata.AAC.1